MRSMHVTCLDMAQHPGLHVHSTPSLPSMRLGGPQHAEQEPGSVQHASMSLKVPHMRKVHNHIN